MRQLLKSKVVFGLGGALVAALIFGAGVAIASIPGSNGVISGCRNNITGSLKVIDKDAGQNCNGIETALNWNQTGPQGPTGPAGPTGPQGPSGGFSGLEVVTGLFPNEGSPNSGEATVMCPSGKVATGGGFDSSFDFLYKDRPVLSSEGKPVGWHVKTNKNYNNDNSAKIFAICVNEL